MPKIGTTRSERQVYESVNIFIGEKRGKRRWRKQRRRVAGVQGREARPAPRPALAYESQGWVTRLLAVEIH